MDIDTHFAVRNPTVEGRNRVVGRVYIEIQVASDDGFVDVVATGRTHERSRGQTNVAANRTLAPSTQYYWRARATASTRAAGQVASIWSRSAAFRTSAVRLGVPRPLAPIDGATVGVNAQFRVRNGTVVGISSRAFVEIEVALTDSFANAIAGRTHMRPRGETIVPLPDRLMPHRRYYWRARVAAGALFSDWSATANFRTSSDTTTSGPAGPFGPGGSPRNMLRILQEVASRNADALRNSCQEEGGSWRFMELAVERLRQETGRWGYNCKRGNCADVSHDALAYYRGSGTTTSAARGSTDVAIIDIIVGHCGPNPQPGWGDVTQATADAGSVGRWKYPR